MRSLFLYHGFTLCMESLGNEGSAERINLLVSECETGNDAANTQDLASGVLQEAASEKSVLNLDTSEIAFEDFKVKMLDAIKKRDSQNCMPYSFNSQPDCDDFCRNRSNNNVLLCRIMADLPNKESPESEISSWLLQEFVARNLCAFEEAPRTLDLDVYEEHIVDYINNNYEGVENLIRSECKLYLQKSIRQLKQNLDSNLSFMLMVAENSGSKPAFLEELFSRVQSMSVLVDYLMGAKMDKDYMQYHPTSPSHYDLFNQYSTDQDSNRYYKVFLDVIVMFKAINDLRLSSKPEECFVLHEMNIIVTKWSDFVGRFIKGVSDLVFNKHWTASEYKRLVSRYTESGSFYNDTDVSRLSLKEILDCPASYDFTDCSCSYMYSSVLSLAENLKRQFCFANYLHTCVINKTGKKVGYNGKIIKQSSRFDDFLDSIEKVDGCISETRSRLQSLLLVSNYLVVKSPEEQQVRLLAMAYLQNSDNFSLNIFPNIDSSGNETSKELLATFTRYIEILDTDTYDEIPVPPLHKYFMHYRKVVRQLVEGRKISCPEDLVPVIMCVKAQLIDISRFLSAGDLDYAKYSALWSDNSADNIGEVEMLLLKCINDLRIDILVHLYKFSELINHLLQLTEGAKEVLSD